MNTDVLYKPYADRKSDTQYKRLLKRILRKGVWYDNQMEEPALTLLGAQLSYDLKNGAPIITERDLLTPGKNGRSYARMAIGEILGFINGAHTQSRLEEFGCFWWKSWLTPEKCGKRGLEVGDMGPGSYGSAWTEFPTGGEPFNQITALIKQIKERPRLRTHVITPWVPQFVFRASGYSQKVVVVPCHGWVNIRVNTQKNSFVLIHQQRSADIPVGFPANMLEYLVFALMIAQVTGYRAERIIYKIDDAHIYKSQLDAVSELLESNDQRLPTVRIQSDKTEITEFRTEDFVIEDYHPTGRRMVIPTPT